MTKVLELFGIPTVEPGATNWSRIVSRQACPFLGRVCVKVRKSQPEVAIGTCSVAYGRGNVPIVICPHRFLERSQVFVDCLHLLTTHQPGNELHLVPEISIPGGSIDYFLVSAKNSKVLDFVGVELQTLDTTGTVWPERQRFLQDVGVSVSSADAESGKSFGMNWKMTAKTILIQLHHKIATFEHVNKHLVLVLQDHFLEYVKREFSLDAVHEALLGDPLHIHSYGFTAGDAGLRINLGSRLSTDTAGVARSLGLQASTDLELEQIMHTLEAKLSSKTLFGPL